MKRQWQKRFFVVFISALLASFAIMPVKAEDPSIDFQTDTVFVKLGESAALAYTVTGNPEVTFDSEEVIDCYGPDEHLIRVSHLKNQKIVHFQSDSQSTGFSTVDVYLNGTYTKSLTVYVYDDTGVMLRQRRDVSCVVSGGEKYVSLDVYPYEARFLPLRVTSSNEAVAVPAKAVMPADGLTFMPLSEGSASITAEYGSQMVSFILNVLPEGDYAEELYVTAENNELYIRRGQTVPVPFEMASAHGSCKDDLLSVAVENDTEGIGDNEVVILNPDGTLTGNRIGSAMLMAYTKLGSEMYCPVHVYSEPEKITFAKDIYYLNQYDEFIDYPVFEVTPASCGNIPVIYTCSDESIISLGGSENTGDRYRYGKPGTVTIRAAYRDNPKIYGEFKAEAFFAEDPVSIKIPSEITAYPDFGINITPEYIPEKSLHRITNASVKDENIAFALDMYSGVVSVTGYQPGTTTLRVQAGSQASAETKVIVKKGKPKSTTAVFTAETNGNSVAFESYMKELIQKESFISGHNYIFYAYKQYENDMFYYGSENQYIFNLEKSLTDSGLFSIYETSNTDTAKWICVRALEPGRKKVILDDGLIAELSVVPETMEMHRLYNPNTGEHFYTGNEAEKDALASLGWMYEGTGWKAPGRSYTPVYRLYNIYAGDHHYTMNEKERDALIEIGWTDEGTGWYSDDDKGVPLYRQYNPNAAAGSHNYTANKKENDALVKMGWQEEGIGWYGRK